MRKNLPSWILPAVAHNTPLSKLFRYNVDHSGIVVLDFAVAWQYFEYCLLLKTMNLDSADLLPFLRAFSSLNQTQQRIFLFLLTHFPRVVLYSQDLSFIATSLSVHVRTVQRALFIIRRHPMLGKCVSIVSFNPKQEIIHEYHDAQKERENSFYAELDVQPD